MLDKVKLFIQTNAVPVVIGLVVFVGYLIFKMKKRNVKIIGR